jgi:chloramphenicol 3-O-phosphotransferase
MTERDIATQSTRTEQNGSDPELTQLKNDLLSLYEEKTKRRKHADMKQQLQPFLSALWNLTDSSDPRQKEQLIQLVKEQLGDTKFAEDFVQGIQEIYGWYITEIAEVVETTTDELTREEVEVVVSLLDGVSDQQRKNIKKYFTEVLAADDKDTRKELLRLLRDVQKINAPSFFPVLFNGKVTGSGEWTDRAAAWYVAKGKRLNSSERQALVRLTTSWTSASGDSGNEKVKQWMQYLATVYGSADFRKKWKEAKGGKLMGYIDQAKKVWEEEKTSEKWAELLQHLISDTDLDADLEALSQWPTHTRRIRRQLEKAQKQEGRGVVSEEGLGALFAKAKKKIESDGKATEAFSVDDILAQNIVTYITTQPKFAYLQAQFADIKTIDTFMDMLFAHPELIGVLRDYARLVPDDFLKVMEWGSAYIAERAATQTKSAEKIEADRKLVEAYLNTEKWVTETVELIDALDQKFRGIALSLESQKDKIFKQLQAANTWVEEMDDAKRQQLVMQYTALNTSQAALADPATAKRAMVDLVHVGWLVSVIPNAQWVGAAATFRFYEAEAKSLLQSIDMQVGGFQWLWGPGATWVGLNIVVGGTLQQSRKNTLFYALHGWTGMQLVQGIRGFWRNAGLTFGDEFWINERKMKKLTPTSKVMIGALASMGISGDFTKLTPQYKPRSAQVGMYLRRDKLAGLEAQQGEIYVTVQEILSKVTDPSIDALRKLITQYCKDQKIKQTPEEIDRVAQVLSSAITPYASELTASKSGKTAPTWMSEVAEQIARNRFNNSTDDASAFAITWVWLGVGFNFLGIYPSVGLQAQIRKSSVYTPDKDSQARTQAAFEQASYDEKFTGSFAENISKINTRFGILEKENQLTQVTRKVGEIGAYPFVHLPFSLLESQTPRVEIYIAPLLVDDTWAFRFQKTEDGIDLPGTMPVSIVQEIRDGVTINKMIIGDTMGKNAVALTTATLETSTFAADDAWIESFQLETERVFFAEKMERVQKQLFDFLDNQTKSEWWKMPFDLTNQANIQVLTDDETKKITGYRIKLIPGAKFTDVLPAWISQANGYLVIPSQIQLDMVYSTNPADRRAPWLLKTTENDPWLAFSYGEETMWFSQSIGTDFNVDLLTNVDSRLRDFISSNQGAEMLMKWRYDTNPVEKDKEKYYQLMRTALKDGNYQPVYDFANTYIVASWSEEAKAVFADMESDWIDKDDRANLYLLYGALSRVRMTEYKHLYHEADKSAILNEQLDRLPKIKEADKQYLRQVLAGKAAFTKVEAILRKTDRRFTWWGDKLYYYNVFKDRKDPMYRLIFLFAPVAKVFETRTTATDRKLNVEFRGDTASKNALMNAYARVQQELNKRPEQLFADQKILDKDVGLVFWYGPSEIDEKFVFYPKSTGAKVDLLASWLTSSEQYLVKKYYLDEYGENNPFDVHSETKALIAGIENQFNNPLVDMSQTEKNAKIAALKDALMNWDQVDVNVYKELMLTGKISSLDRFNTGDNKSLLNFSMDWWIAAYSECVNFMIVKWTPKIQMKLKKKYQWPVSTPAEVELQMVSHPGEVVAEQVVIQNQANRRVKNMSVGLVGGVFKDPETGQSSTLPVDISEEDFDKIILDPTPSSMTISTTGEQVNAFAGSFWNKSGMFYIDSATGNRKFFEWTITPWQNNTLIFTPASNASNVNVADVLYTGRHLGELGNYAVNTVMQARLKARPYDAYQKQMLDLRKSEIDRIKAKRQKK